jgi:CIC family chloride channel protein
LIALLIAKLVASALSISSGFRGGMFSSSLFLGGLFGAVVAAIVTFFIPGLAPFRVPIIIVGMGSVAAGIVGAPLTMAFLVLESTGDFAMTVGVLVGVVTSSTIVRLAFGYSFSTWRFHLRGLPIRGAHDIGWLADLTVDKVMRVDAVTVPADMRLRDLRKNVPLGSARHVFVTDHGGRYLGAVDVVAAHDASIDDAADNIVAGDLAESPTLYLTPQENVRTALARFESNRQETLPVVSVPDLIILGYLTEAYALRRYAEELERRRSAELGEKNLFSIGQLPQ